MTDHQRSAEKRPGATPDRAGSILVACAGDGSTGGVLRLDPMDGRTQREASIAGLACVVRHPALPVVYTLTGPDDGALQTWSTDGGFRLRATRSTDGLEPCHLAVHPSGRALVVVNYGSGTLLGVGLGRSGVPASPGRLVALTGGGPVGDRQDAAHPHQAVFVGERHLLLVPDLGADLLRVFTLDVDDGSLTPVGASPLPPGTGPRHLVTPRGGLVAVTGELAETLCVTTVDEATGEVGAWRTTPSTRSRGTRRNFPGHVIAVPGTDVVYLANRGADTLARFDLGDSQPRLLDEHDAGVTWPQHLAVIDGALLVAGRDSSQVVRLPITPQGEPAGPPEPIAALPSPVWLAP